VIDRPGSIDPLVAEGPRSPVNSLRPGVSQQRTLMLDGPTPMMLDLAEGNIRPYENGRPVSVPMSSTPFDLSIFDRIQVQLMRGPSPTSKATTHFSVQIGQGDRVIEVRETRDGLLEITDDRTSASGAIGTSPALVVLIETRTPGQDPEVVVSARNAETLDGPSLAVTVPSVDDARFTVGGSTYERTGSRGLRRSMLVQIDVVPHREPVDQVRRVVGAAKRAAGSLRDRTR